MFDRLTVGRLQENCYLYVCPETRQGVLIDPGADGERLKRWVKEHDADIRYILLTHGHGDHIGAVEMLRRAYRVQVGIHAADAPLLADVELNLSAHWGNPATCAPADLLLEDREKLAVGKVELTVIHTPGHTGGSCCFLTSEALFAGDTLFYESMGRTDLPGGSEQDMEQSIKQKLLPLPDETLVLPGHGKETTIGWEKKHSPCINL